MRHVSHDDGGPRKSSAAMEQPATTNSTSTKTLTSPAEMTAVRLLQALLFWRREELAKEREAVRPLQVDGAAEMTAVREEEAARCRNLLCDRKGSQTRRSDTVEDTNLQYTDRSNFLCNVRQ